MESNQENIKVVQDAFAAFLRGDVAAVLAACDPSIEVEFFGPPTLPMSGQYQGLAGLQEYLTRVVSTVEFVEFKPQEFLCEGNSVVVLGYTQSRAHATGREGRVSWAVAFKITGGKISRYRVHEDTGTLAQLLATP